MSRTALATPATALDQTGTDFTDEIKDELASTGWIEADPEKRIWRHQQTDAWLEADDNRILLDTGDRHVAMQGTITPISFLEVVDQAVAG